LIKPKIDILPAAQQALWPELKAIPNQFILYGGTAIALQLGHRESIDFDFFSLEPLNRDVLIEAMPFLRGCRLVQPEINTIDTFIVSDLGTVKIQFLAGLKARQGRIKNPLICEDNKLQLASLDDLFATKLNTIQARAQLKDYLDIYAMLQGGLSLEYGLACAQAIYGNCFDPATSLKALTSYNDGDLSETPLDVKNHLTKQAIKVKNIPVVKAIISPSE